jgi:hypothetical protein
MWHGKCVSKSVRLARVRGQPEARRYVPAELATKCQQFFHKFLLNDTFAPAERFNPKLALGTVGRNCPADWQEVSASVDGLRAH